MELQSASPFETTIPVDYASGSHGYISTRPAFAEGGYEEQQRVRHLGLAITEGAGEVLVAEAAKSLHGIHRG